MTSHQICGIFRETLIFTMKIPSFCWVPRAGEWEVKNGPLPIVIESYRVMGTLQDSLMLWGYPLVICIEHGPVEIVDDYPLIAWWIFPVRYVNVYQAG